MRFLFIILSFFTFSISFAEDIAIDNEFEDLTPFLHFFIKKTANFEDGKISYEDSITHGDSSKDRIKKIILLGPDEQIKEPKKNKISKNPFLEDKELKKQLSEFIRCELNTYQIERIKECIITFFRNHGLPFIIVTTPEQEINNGIIYFRVYFSKIGNVKIEGNKYFKKDLIENFVSIKKNESVNTNKIAQDIYWINKNPFRNASVLFKPGKEKLTTDVDYLIEDRRTFRVYAGADNTGFHTTGRNRLYTGFNWGNVWNLDHILSFQFSTSTKFNRFNSVTADYSIPFLGKHLIRAYGGYSWFDPSNAIQDLSHKGRASQASLRYTMALKPFKKRYLHDLSLGFDYKRTNTNLVYRQRSLIGNTTLITQLALEYASHYESQYFNMPIEIKSYLSCGDIFADQSNHDFSSLRFRARNAYGYVNLYFSPYVYLPYDMRFSLNIQSQFATNNLLPSEQFGLGGYNSVRGYEYREVNKDSGIITSYEFSLPFFNVIKRLRDQMRIISFVDFGFGWDHKKTPEIKDPEYLLGIGAGIRYTIRSYLSLRLDWAFKLHKTDFDRDGSNLGRAHFGLLCSY